MTRASWLTLVVCLIVAPACQAPEPTSEPSSPPATEVAATHPLDPLTTDEIRTAVAVARGDARLATAAFHLVTLEEPSKADVLAWLPGDTLVRLSRLQAMTPAAVYKRW